MNKMQKALVAVAATATTAPAMAYDWSAVTGDIDFSGEITAIAAVIGLLATVYVTIKGGKVLLGMLRG